MHTFSEAEKQKLALVEQEMLEVNQRMNLTRITETNEIWEKHFLDSVLPLSLFDVPRGTKCIDIGTGAGFPGVPIKIVRPDIEMTLLDSLNKRIQYLQRLAEQLALPFVCIHGRSEELAHHAAYREQYTMAISRAVANLPALLELALPLVRIGGYFLAMKGQASETENTAYALSLLGGKIESVIPYQLPCGDNRHLIIIKKISHTPAKYPRKHTNITKNPLLPPEK